MTLPTTVAESWVDQIFGAVESEILASGWFERVNTHEPKSSPGNGLTCAIWVQRISALPGASPLTHSSALVTLNIRCYTSMTAEPQDEIDPNLLKAVSNIMRRYHDNYDFGLHPLVRNVDLLGEFGQPLEAVAGYVDVSGKLCRVMTITLPIVVNDVWPQG